MKNRFTKFAPQVWARPTAGRPPPWLTAATGFTPAPSAPALVWGRLGDGGEAAYDLIALLRQQRGEDLGEYEHFVLVDEKKVSAPAKLRQDSTYRGLGFTG